MPPRSAKMKRRIFGFQRRVWWPKWTPASSRSRMETAPVEAGSVETGPVETDMGKLLPDSFCRRAPAEVEAHLPRGEARAPRLGRRGVGTGRGKVSWVESPLVRVAFSACPLQRCGELRRERRGDVDRRLRDRMGEREARGVE